MKRSLAARRETPPKERMAGLHMSLEADGYSIMNT